MDHREAAAALHADVGGEVRHDRYQSYIVIRQEARGEPEFPHAHASVFQSSGRVYITVAGADDNLARAILRLVVEARGRAGQTQGGER